MLIFQRKRRWQLLDKKVRLNFLQSEIDKKILKSLIFSEFYSKSLKLYFASIFLKYSRYTSISFTQHFCLLNGGTGRSVFRRFKMGRHYTKLLAIDGFLPGLRKSSF